VIEFILKMKGEYPGIVALRGNHEDFVLSLLQGKKDEYLRQIWLEIDGGKHTLSSYSRSGHSLSVHEEFFKKLPLSWETDDYFFCHAGVRPGVPLGKQSPVDLLEIREGFIDSAVKFEKIIVHGHTPVGSPSTTPHRINIDTGAGKDGPLTALELPSLKIWQRR
jgi:serine/threonine protein phosphatase 1